MLLKYWTNIVFGAAKLLVNYCVLVLLKFWSNIVFGANKILVKYYVWCCSNIGEILLKEVEEEEEEGEEEEEEGGFLNCL
jgi:hypothetical protein